MEFFDGKQEALLRSGRGWLEKKEIKGRFKSGQTPLTLAFSLSWMAMLVFMLLFMPFILLSIILGFLENFNSGLNCFLVTFFVVMLLIGVPSVLLIFIATLISSGKRLKKNLVHVSDEFVEVTYWKGGKQYPIQVTRIPFKNIKDVHPVTDEEWKTDMKMSNIFRWISMWPFLGPSSRFPQGTMRKHVFTIEFQRKMEIHGYADQNESMRVLFTLAISPLFGLIGEDIQEELYMDDRMYISMSQKAYKRFEPIVKKRLGPTYRYEDAHHRYHEPDHAPGKEVDESSYMDLIYNTDGQMK